MIRAPLLAAMFLPGLALGQSLAFEDNFDCDDDTTFGTSLDRGWDNVLNGDAWSADFNDGVSPLTDNGAGTFGNPIDDYENFLVTGSQLWSDTAIAATLINNDDDWMGLVARFSGAGSYYTCGLTNDQAQDCGGAGGGVADGVYLRRVDTSMACAANYDVDTAPYTFAAGAPIRVELSVIGDQVTCAVDVDQNGIGVGADLVLSYVDPTPLPSGRAGLASFQNGNANGDMEFDDIEVTTFDPDQDSDGLPDAVEALVGSDPANPDSDGDGIIDWVEVRYPPSPDDEDGDGTPNWADIDSDNDGLLDSDEAPNGEPIDSDCGGSPDFTDTDSDDDGDLDGVDNCVIVANPPQTDTDGDGIGDACESVCGDSDVLVPVETCDDGNVLPGDGCSATCQVEAGFECGVLLPFQGTAVEDYGNASDWVINNETTTTQILNTDPSIFVTSLDAQASSITASVRVNVAADDDFIGFVLGVDAGVASDPTADYLLIDWKQATQAAFATTGDVGLAVSRVNGIPNTTEFWGHQGRITELDRAATLGSTAWAENTVYNFVFEYTSTRLLVTVNGIVEFDLVGDFPQGKLGLYEFSQEQTQFSVTGTGECASWCGDGIQAANEACDDGDVTVGDGCSEVCQEEDADGDGLTDFDEVGVYGTDPFDPDTDAGGIDDGTEVLTDGTDPLDPVDDQIDTDGDGLIDGEEVAIYGTDPLNPDTDGGTVDDGTEVLANGTDPLDPSDDVPVVDTDGDGLLDGDETGIYGTDPLNPDTDGDALTDGDEVLVHRSEERRVGKECHSRCRSRWSPYH